MRPVSTKALFLSIAAGTALAMAGGGWVGAASAASGASGAAVIDAGARTASDGVEIVQYREQPRAAPRHQDQYRGQYRGRPASVASREHVMRILRQNGFSRVQNLRLVTANTPRGYRGPARQYYLANGWRRGGYYRITADARTGQLTNTTRIARPRGGAR